MLCTYCCDLSLQKLHEIAEKRRKSSDLSHSHFHVHARYYFKHWPSWNRFLQSVDDGCELCYAFWDNFRSYGLIDDIENEADNGVPTDLRICLDPRDSAMPPRYQYEFLIVQVGQFKWPKVYCAAFMLNKRWNQSLTRYCDLSDTERGSLSMPYLDEARIGRYFLSHDLGSDENFEVAKTWLKHCENSNDHYRCPSNRDKTLPPRVIDVGSDGEDTPKEVKLFLTEGRKGAYIALSHCWGGYVPLLTTSRNIDDHVAGILEAELPRTFRDAVKVTRKLGFRFLWIDSLCIIQNSKADWNAHVGIMGDIYRHSILTIAAAVSESPYQGMLNYDRQGAHDDRRARYTLKWNSESDELVHLRPVPTFQPNHRGYASSDEIFFDCLHHSPLVQRGWTFQERHLSPRIMHYGARQIYWECLTTFHSADGAALSLSVTQSNYSDWSPEFNPKDLDDAYEKWYYMLQEYSMRNFTVNTDRIPAIAGLASAVQRYTKGTYLAGVWLEDIHSGLLWSSRGEGSPQPDLSPSWSWAWVLRIAPCSRRKDRVQTNTDAEILRHNIELRGQSPFGEVKAGSLEIRGLMRRVVRSKGSSRVRGPPYGRSIFLWGDADNALASTVYERDRLDPAIGCPWLDMEDEVILRRRSWTDSESESGPDVDYHDPEQAVPLILLFIAKFTSDFRKHVEVDDEEVEIKSNIQANNDDEDSVESRSRRRRGHQSPEQISDNENVTSHHHHHRHHHHQSNEAISNIEFNIIPERFDHQCFHFEGDLNLSAQSTKASPSAINSADSDNEGPDTNERGPDMDDLLPSTSQPKEISSSAEDLPHRHHPLINNSPKEQNTADNSSTISSSSEHSNLFRVSKVLLPEGKKGFQYSCLILASIPGTTKYRRTGVMDIAPRSWLIKDDWKAWSMETVEIV